jgi:hypothetical protein
MVSPNPVVRVEITQKTINDRLSTLPDLDALNASAEAVCRLTCTGWVTCAAPWTRAPRFGWPKPNGRPRGALAAAVERQSRSPVGGSALCLASYPWTL